MPGSDRASLPLLFPVKPFHIRYGSPHKPPRKNSVKGLHRKRRAHETIVLLRPQSKSTIVVAQCYLNISYLNEIDCVK